VTAVEPKEIFGETVTQAGSNSTPDIFTGPGDAESLAFETQECNLVEWIHGPQARIELQTVDDPDLVVQPDVLGAQITVPIDNAPIMQAPNEHLAVAREKAALDEVYPPDQTRWKRQSATEQNLTILCKALMPVGEEQHRRYQYRRHPAIELDERGSQQIELPALEAPLLNRTFESLIFVKPAHHHKPVHDVSVSPNQQAASCYGERHHR
jgi:hypothetical protein